MLLLKIFFNPFVQVSSSLSKKNFCFLKENRTLKFISCNLFNMISAFRNKLSAVSPFFAAVRAMNAKPFAGFASNKEVYNPKTYDSLKSHKWLLYDPKHAVLFPSQLFPLKSPRTLPSPIKVFPNYIFPESQLSKSKKALFVASYLLYIYHK